MRFLTIIVLMSACFTLTSGCRADAESSAKPKVEALASGSMAPREAAPAARKAQSFHYSPFILRLEGSHFDLVSFKDVGMKFGDEDAEVVYETIAESLAMSLAEDEALGIEAEVAYDERVLDPKNHVSCGLTQLYVDVWRDAASAKWGFSLWSGCSEDDKFAWKELEYDAKRVDPIEQITPLTKSIAHTLRKASETECF
ncbi:MAG: hypothetical protein AAGI01_14565, partial [Myxococcota bacterium]